MSNWSYNVPDEDDFLYTLIEYIKRDNTDLANKLSRAKISLIDSNWYCGNDCHVLSTTLSVPILDLDRYSREELSQIKNACNKIVPNETGFVVQNIELSPLIISKNPLKNNQYSLKDKEYDEILNIIYNAGKSYERNPTGIIDLDEEGIRDNLLAVLNTHVEGNATGETFNRTGKTDIRINNSKNEIFIAECKIWNGPQTFIDAIDQLESYTGWRDTKNALIIFCPNKNISEVFMKITKIIESHDQYYRTIEVFDLSFRKYLFHHKDDKNIIQYLSVIVIHIPK